MEVSEGASTMGQSSKASGASRAADLGHQDFFEHDGYISRGGDLMTRTEMLLPFSTRTTMTVDDAKAMYKSLPGCKGFCHKGGPTKEPVEMVFKDKWDFVPFVLGMNRWTSYQHRDEAPYGASPLHFAVWRGDATRTQTLLNGGASLHVVDADGQTPWAWAEVQGNEAMMEILSEYGGGPLPIWSLKVEPSASPQSDMSLSFTNMSGETVCQLLMSPSDSVANVFIGIAHETGKSATLLLPNNHILGSSDRSLTLRELLDSPPQMEKRKDPNDGLNYTKREFFKFYGQQAGHAQWAKATPDEAEAACAQSLMEITEVENTMVNEAVFRSLNECDGGKTAVTQILVIGFNMHPLEFTNAICDSALAQSLCKSGIDISPPWANGAKILIEGLTPSVMKEAGFPPEDLHLWHVLVNPENEKDVFESLRSLTYKKRPRQKTRKVITCQTRPSKPLPCEGAAHDDSDSCEEHELEKADGTFIEEAPQWAPEENSSSFLEGICVTRTFFDITKPERVGWSPRTVYTKSSNDGHGIENPRVWK